MPAAVPVVHGRSSSAPASIEGDSGILLPPNRFYDEESQRISNLIDEELRVSWFLLRNSIQAVLTGPQKESQRQKEVRRRQVKVMLLGQAESGMYAVFHNVAQQTDNLLRQINPPKTIPNLLRLPIS